jgi:uncharacterized protein (DUF2236 family)
MLIFAGSAAEFALNKANDWLFFTELLPNAPIDRFFETVRFAQAMVFGDEAEARAAVEAVNHAHQHVEEQRGGSIPQWSYRDTLFMLVEYAERAHEIVFGPLGEDERLTLFAESMEIGRLMGIRGLPDDYDDYRLKRQQHIHNHLAHTDLTDRLYAKYREHIGPVRMLALLDVQASLVPDEVRQMLGLKRRQRVDLLLGVYRHTRIERLLRLLYPVLLPRGYGQELSALQGRAKSPAPHD